MKTYLVTGGAGFIGSNFILYLLQKYKDIQVINIDKLTYAGNLENLKAVENNQNYKFIKADINDKSILEEIFQKYDVDYVVHFAAESHVDRSIKDPEIFIKTNVLGTINLLHAAKEAWEEGTGFKSHKKFLHISTDEVYGSLGDTGYFTENTSIQPHSPYAASKAASDLIVQAYYDTYGMPVNITRCSNNYGPYQFPEKLIPLMIYNCVNGKKLPVYGDGLNIRDWIYVEDHCSAIDVVLEKGEIGQVYNVGGKNERKNIEIVKIIIQFIHDHVKESVTEACIQYIQDRKGHDRRYAIDATKIMQELQWSPQVPFEEGIQRTIQWYVENQEWLSHVTSGAYERYYEEMYHGIENVEKSRGVK